jgi:hypothetical protein
MAATESKEGADTPYASDQKDATTQIQTAVGDLVGEEVREIDPVIEARVLRKIDWFFMPAMVFGNIPLS